MPLIEVRQLAHGLRLGLWRIEEESDLTPRKREQKAVHLLLAAMTGDSNAEVSHESSGKPYLASSNPEPPPTLSISHTKGYAAVLLAGDNNTRVGIDIEYRSDRVERIASRFIHKDEKADSTTDKLLLWSAKEAVYKCFSEDSLLFFDMRLRQRTESLLAIENLKRGVTVSVNYELTADYVLTYLAY